MCSYLLLVSYLISKITENNCGLTPRFNGNMLVVPPDGVHYGSNDAKRKARYLLTHFDKFQTGVVDTPCEVWSPQIIILMVFSRCGPKLQSTKEHFIRQYDR